MKTIVLNETEQSKYVFNDDRVVTIGSDDIQIEAEASAPYHNKLGFGVQDLNSSNCTLYTGVTPPDDWKQDKYFFDGTTWTLNETDALVWGSLGKCSSATCNLYLRDVNDFSPTNSKGRRIGFPEKCPVCGSDFNAPAGYNAPS
tara:strand:- start:519 stop:950 length:432 start_codon:yes stop_codon:yes gene_type:complete